jgi:hypothetical protein
VRILVYIIFSNQFILFTGEISQNTCAPVDKTLSRLAATAIPQQALGAVPFAQRAAFDRCEIQAAPPVLIVVGTNVSLPLQSKNCQIAVDRGPS